MVKATKKNGGGRRRYNLKLKTMYKIPTYAKSSIKSVEKVEGETIEMKIERIVDNKEPIKDGAPEIFTERAQGVMAAYNIRTDRWEVAADAMDAISRSKQAERDNRMKPKDEGDKGNKGKDSGAESTHGKDSGAESTHGKGSADSTTT